MHSETNNTRQTPKAVYGLVNRKPEIDLFRKYFSVEFIGVLDGGGKQLWVNWGKKI